MSSARGDISRNLNICLIVFSTTIVAVRFYIRGHITKSLGLDDAIALIGLILLIALSSCEIREVELGGGMNIQDVPPANLEKFFNLLPTMQLLYLWATATVRLAIIAFLPRLNRDRGFMMVVWALGATVVISTLVCFFVLLFECKHIPDLWDRAKPTRQCLNPQHEAYMFWTHAAIGLFVDVMLLVVPLWFIHSCMVFSASRKRVMLVFSVGLFVVVTGAIRLGLIVTTNFAENTTYVLIRVSTWTDVEGHVGLWVSSFPALQPVLRSTTQRLGLTTKHGTNENKLTQNFGQTSSTWKSKSRGYWQHITNNSSRGDSSDFGKSKGTIHYDEREAGQDISCMGPDVTGEVV